MAEMSWVLQHILFTNATNAMHIAIPLTLSLVLLIVGPMQMAQAVHGPTHEGDAGHTTSSFIAGLAMTFFGFLLLYGALSL